MTAQAAVHNIHMAQRDRLFAVAHPTDRKFLTETFGRVPQGFHGKLIGGYVDTLASQGRRAANLQVLNLQELFPERGLDYAADDDEIHHMAEVAAKEVRNSLPMMSSEVATMQALESVAHRYQVSLPNFKEPEKIISRMITGKWWRRRLRARFQKIEHAAIKAGFVHRRAGVYVSDEAHKRRQRHKKKSAQMLENMEAVNELGESFTLGELSALNVSNPAIRRAELMTRVRGMDDFSKLIGYSAILLTVTCPGRMHAYLSGSGTRNPRYDETKPDTAQRYLNKLWGKVQAKLGREDIQYFGLRVVEPHHDGTPHWHMLVFVNPEQEAALIDTMRAYALADSPDEPGAQEHRFTVVHIDPAKGSAVGYVAKYIAKNLDGEHVDMDYESESPAKESAMRVESWASLWNIRQFQFFGAPKVTPWRELRRLKKLPEAYELLLGPLWRAADLGDFYAYMKYQNDHGIRLEPLWQEQESASHPGEVVRQVRGVRVLAQGQQIELETREHQWVIREKESAKRERLSWKSAISTGGIGLPWTRVNNSTHEVKEASKPKHPLPWNPENTPNDMPQFDIGGIGFYRSHDGQDILVTIPGFQIGSFAKEEKSGGSRPTGAVPGRPLTAGGRLK